MRIKTLLELATLSSSIYYLAKENKVLERFSAMSENKAVNDDVKGEGEFIDKIISKTSQLKDELEEKIEESVVSFYKKINIAHSDEIRGLKDQLEKSDMAIALLEARLNKLEAES